MKPSELLKRTPESVVYPLELDNEFENKWKFFAYFQGSYYDHLQELDVIDDTVVAIKKSLDIRIDVYKDFCYDGRRTWRLCSVYWKETPVMIIQNAGREGDDYTNRFILNREKYIEMIECLRDLIVFDQNFDYIGNDCVDVEDDVPNLIDFYNQSLDEKFEPYYMRF